ncbi:MAG TPA: ABC transporter permease, partial [Chryseosolibacter sp.]
MVANYLKTARRNLAKHKLYSVLNTIGLSTGIAFCLLIYLYIRDEHNFDRFHTNADRIYRLESAMYFNELAAKGEYPYNLTNVQASVAPLVKELIPEAEYATRMVQTPAVVQCNGKVFNEDITSVDADFFRMFSFPPLRGTTTGIFRLSTEAVITQAMAVKYFGDEDPVGKTIRITGDSQNEYNISAVIQTPPPNSSLAFGIVVPLESQPWLKAHLGHWGVFRYTTFVQLRKGADRQAFITKLNKILAQHMGETLKQFEERLNAPEGEKAFQYLAIPLADIHFRTAFKRTHKVSDPQFSWVLGGIALLILVIACINYISLALTSSSGRRREVGIRKVVGAARAQLIAQFYIESVLLALCSMVLGIAMAALFLPSFNEFTSKEIRFMNIEWPLLAAFALGLATILGIVAGSYPALYLSRIRPGPILKSTRFGARAAGFINPLVVFQFALSFFLVFSSVVMLRQMNYVAHKDLGYDPEMVVVVATQSFKEEDATRTADQLMAALEKTPGVMLTARASNSFNRGRSVYGAELYRVDPGYIPTLGLELTQGRNFDASNAADKNKTIIVNEALVKANGWKNPLAENFEGSRVIGVVKDYHFRSLEYPIEPVVLTMEASEFEFPRHVLVRISAQDVPGTLEKIRKAWNEIVPDKPFEYSFLEEDVGNQYASYHRWTAIMSFSTGFAILIACLGLFGIAGFNASRRVSEIGIRKVFGAGLMSIFVLLNRQYLLFVCIAFAIAVPCSVYMMDQWLANFKFRITP